MCIQQHICRLCTKANGLAMNFHFCISYFPGLLNPIMFPKQYLLFTNNSYCYQLFTRPAGIFMAEEIFWTGHWEEEMPYVKGIGLKTQFLLLLLLWIPLDPVASLATSTPAWALALKFHPTWKYLSPNTTVKLEVTFLTSLVGNRVYNNKRPALVLLCKQEGSDTTKPKCSVSQLWFPKYLKQLFSFMCSPNGLCLAGSFRCH